MIVFVGLWLTLLTVPPFPAPSSRRVVISSGFKSKVKLFGIVRSAIWGARIEDGDSTSWPAAATLPRADFRLSLTGFGFRGVLVWGLAAPESEALSAIDGEE